VLGEYHHVPEGLGDPVGVLLGDEEPAQSLGSQVVGDARRIAPHPGGLHRFRIDVGGEDLNRESGPHRLQGLADEDGQGVGLLTGGAAHHPGPEAPPLRRRQGQLVAQDPRGEGLPRIGIAEEVGHADDGLLEQEVRLGGVGPEKGQVLAGIAHAVDVHAPLQAPQQGALLVAGEIVAGALGDRLQDARQNVLGDVRMGPAFPPAPLGFGLGVGEEGGGHVAWTQDIVHQIGGDGAVRHALEAGGLGLLDHDHAGL